MTILPIKHIGRKPGSDIPYIIGTRFSVPVLISTLHNNPDRSIPDMAERFGLTAGQIYAALSYYHDHKAEIERLWAEGEALAEEVGALTLADLQRRIDQRRSTD